MTTELTQTQGIGGYAGKLGEKQWLAEIHPNPTGKGFNRVFVNPQKVTRDKFNTTRYMRTYHYDLSAGLYECSEHGERMFLICNGAKWWRGDQTRVDAIIAHMSDGITPHDAVTLTRKPKPNA